MENQVRLKLDKSAASAVDAYWEYRQIVGDDDNGEMFTPEQYEEYKQKVLPQRSKNRIYVSWSNPNGMDCKLIGPETLCFCLHRYKQHQTDFDNSAKSSKDLKCKVKSCKCSGYQYIPKNGNRFLKCHCKHSSDEHNSKIPHACIKCQCNGFSTSFRCGCGSLVAEHQLIIESRDERIQRGHPVPTVEPPYAAMGGITGMSSLIDGYMRLDDSGIGAPPAEFFNQPSSSRSLQPSVNSNRQLHSRFGNSSTY